MPRFSITTIIACGILLSTISAAAEKYDPAAHAATIAPYLDDQAIIVGRVDLTRIDAPAIVEQVTKTLGLPKQQTTPITLGALGVQTMVDSFVRAGCREVYTVVSVTDLPQERGFLIVPVDAQGDRKAVDTLLRSTALFGRKKNLVISQLADSFYVGSDETLSRIKKLKPFEHPSLVEAFESAGDSTAQILILPSDDHRRVIREMLPELPDGVGKGKDLADGLQWIAVSFKTAPKISIDLTIQSKDAATATALKSIIATSLQRIGTLDQVRRAVPAFDEASKLLLPKVTGNQLKLNFNLAESKLLTWFVLPAVGASRQSAQRSACSNNLKRMGVAMHNFHEIHKQFPAAASYNKDGKPLLSWRVHLLPFMQQTELYKQFHLDEPWDSPHNRTLISKMPSVFACPSTNLRAKNMTTYLVPVGKGTVFDGKAGKAFRDITDGTSNTIMIVDADPLHAVIWTKPDDLPFDPKNPLAGLVSQHGNGFQAIFCDGSVRFISQNVDLKILQLLFTCADGKPVGKF